MKPKIFLDCLKFEFRHSNLLMLIIHAGMIISFALLIWLFVVTGFNLINSGGVRPTQLSQTIIERKEIVQSSFTPIYTGSGYAFLDIEEQYVIYFKINGVENRIRLLNKVWFENSKVGDKVEVGYGFGRLNKSIEPKNIRALGNN